MLRILSAALVSLPLISGYTITLLNSCDEPVWPAAWQSSEGEGTNGGPTGQAFPSLPIDQTGHGALYKGQSWSITPPAHWKGGRVWGRTGCTGEGDSFKCQTGDCIGGLHCTNFRSATGGDAGSQMYTKAEWVIFLKVLYRVANFGSPRLLCRFGYGSSYDPTKPNNVGPDAVYWNLSRVLGYNLPVSITDTKSGEKRQCLSASCGPQDAYVSENDNGAMDMSMNANNDLALLVEFCPSGASAGQKRHKRRS